MKSATGYLVAVAAACFLAGTAFGLALQRTVDAREVPGQNPREAYIERFAEQFGLSSQQIRDLRAVLLKYDEDRMRIATSFEVERWPPEARTQLLNADRRKAERVEYLLDERQRAMYRKLTTSTLRPAPQDTQK